MLLRRGTSDSFFRGELSLKRTTWNLRSDFGCFHFHIGLSMSAKVSGVNSKTPDGRHFLMFDFDSHSFEDIVDDLIPIQERHHLSDIYVLNTGKPNHYHAYCFTAFEWLDAVKILSESKCIDPIYLKIAFVRGFFTLRFTQKRGRTSTLEGTVSAGYKPNFDPRTLADFVQYYTKWV